MLVQRVITAVVLLILILAMLNFANDIIWYLFAGVIGLIGIYEYLSFFKVSLVKKILFISITSIIGLYLYYDNSFLNKYHTFFYMIPFIFWLIFVPIWISKKIKIHNFFLIAVVGWILFLPFWYVMYKLRDGNILGFNFDILSLLFLMGIVWIADIGAYFSGRIFGKRKLAPTISPGKTLEGLLGAIICVSIYYLILLLFFKDYAEFLRLVNPIILYILFIFFVFFSVIGDLFESLLKRQANIKDSGKILPGHGGVYDRIDALIAVLGMLPFSFFIISYFS